MGGRGWGGERGRERTSYFIRKEGSLYWLRGFHPIPLRFESIAFCVCVSLSLEEVCVGSHFLSIIGDPPSKIICQGCWAGGWISIPGRTTMFLALGRLSFSAWVSVVSDSTRRINEIKKAAISMELDAVRLCGQKRRQDEMTNQRTTCSRFRSLLAASSFPLWTNRCRREQHEQILAHSKAERK